LSLARNVSRKSMKKDGRRGKIMNKDNYGTLEACKRHNHLHAYAIGLQKPIIGEDVSTHIFTEREVLFMRYIKGLYPHVKNSDIASFYGCSWRAVENVWIGKTWKHI
jgi:hypothetical protein